MASSPLTPRINPIEAVTDNFLLTGTFVSALISIDQDNQFIGIDTNSPDGLVDISSAQQDVTSTVFSDAPLRLSNQGTVDNDGATTLALATSNVTNYGITISGRRTGSSGSPAMEIRRHDNSNTGTVEMSMNTSGVISGDFNDTSDVSLKENIQDLDSGISIISQLIPRKFNWKEALNKGSSEIHGFIAQEVEATIPELISQDLAGMKSINTIGLIAHLTKAVQELKQENDDLLARVETLENA